MRWNQRDQMLPEARKIQKGSQLFLKLLNCKERNKERMKERMNESKKEKKHSEFPKQTLKIHAQQACE